MRRVYFGQTDSVPKTWKIDNWSSMSQVERMRFLRQVSSQAGQNPEIATLCVDIFRSQNIPPRAYKKQAEALLKWVQQNIYYVNEPQERLCEPMYTLKVGYGDCDDMALLLGAMCESVKLEYRYVLAGKCNGKIDRWIEGEPYKEGEWSHIYLIIGYPPFRPQKWVYAEPTLQTAQLGWDIVQAKNGGASLLPELAGDMGSSGITIIGKRPKTPILTSIKEGLDLSVLIPTIVLGAITSVAIGELADYIRRMRKKI